MSNSFRNSYYHWHYTMNGVYGPRTPREEEDEGMYDERTYNEGYFDEYDWDEYDEDYE